MSLKELLGEDLYNQVQSKVDEAEDDVELMINDGSHIPRDRLNDKNSEIEALQEQLEAKDDQIEQMEQQLDNLKNDTQATEELQQKIKKYEEENSQLEEEIEQLSEEKEQEIMQEKKGRALEVALANNGAKHPNLLMKEADLDSLEFEDGEVKNVDDVLGDLQEEYEDMFEEKTSKGGSEFAGGSEETKDLENMDMDEYIKERNNN